MFQIFNHKVLGYHNAPDLTKMFDSNKQAEVLRTTKRQIYGRILHHHIPVTIHPYC
jgi:hypothetical protein